MLNATNNGADERRFEDEAEEKLAGFFQAMGELSGLASTEEAFGEDDNNPALLIEHEGAGVFSIFHEKGTWVVLGLCGEVLLEADEVDDAIAYVKRRLAPFIP